MHILYLTTTLYNVYPKPIYAQKKTTDRFYSLVIFLCLFIMHLPYEGLPKKAHLMTKWKSEWTKLKKFKSINLCYTAASMDLSSTSLDALQVFNHMEILNMQFG